MGVILGLFLILASFQSFLPVHAESHELNFRFTTLWSPKGSSPPHTQIIASLDDVPIIRYSSSNRKLQLLFDWMRNVDSGHWDTMEETAKHYEQRHQHIIQRLSPSQNYTHPYVFQVKFGCHIYEDNSTSGEEEFGAHGRDFIFLDNEKRKFMASVDEATEIANEWNRRPNRVKRQFLYKDVSCVQWMRDYLRIKNDDVPKNVHPEVKVWGRTSDGKTRLNCLVYGFHPKDVIVKWVRNGTDQVPSDEESPILPHPDGTYQIRVSVEVPTMKGDSYACHVDHSSLGDETLSINIEADQISYTEKRSAYSWMFSLGFILLVCFVAYMKFSERGQGCSKLLCRLLYWTARNLAPPFGPPLESSVFPLTSYQSGQKTKARTSPD